MKVINLWLGEVRSEIDKGIAESSFIDGGANHHAKRVVTHLRISPIGINHQSWLKYTIILGRCNYIGQSARQGIGCFYGKKKMRAAIVHRSRVTERIFEAAGQEEVAERFGLFLRRGSCDGSVVDSSRRDPIAAVLVQIDITASVRCYA